ncbi:kinase-like domain-containing protein [Crepidotus variabilis]|uniref:Kinase-like domain-containing protein n=1 Tax=Crepidotus variabilis TaxID=179855 RepID=A0A9P6EJ91_9AGAR|nr:kinase-like domain-containing protein [Crepidotus variabilis]
MSEYVISGGFCDLHRIAVGGVVTCFRVMRQTETDSKKEVYKRFCSELSIWHQLKHPNILPLIGATMEIFPGRFCFLLPWLSHGSIVRFIKTHPEHDKYLAISQIADGLDYLHNLDPPVWHKDIKGENVLVNDDLVCMITDFDLSWILEEQRSMTRGLATLYWSPPEILSDSPLDEDSRPRDVFSFGCTIYEILVGQVPKYIWWTVMKIQPLVLPPPRSPDWEPEEQQLWQMAERCLQVLPENRPLIADIKNEIISLRS